MAQLHQAFQTSRGDQTSDRALESPEDGQIWQDEDLRAHFHDHVFPGELEGKDASSAGKRN